ncbi:MAG: TolC family protein [Magnetococcales bacterium]|nr:TolC family protein [Magnetococcales bacterium]
MNPGLFCGALLLFHLASPALAQEETAQDLALGRSLSGLLDYARQHNPDYRVMHSEAAAAEARAAAAGTLADPKMRMEWRDITRFGEQSPTLNPSRVGSTRYLLMQDVPWFGKRDLQQQVATAEATGADSQVVVTWAELAARVCGIQAQRYFSQQGQQLLQQTVALMKQLEQNVRDRYAGGLASQQDVVRAQLEQTALQSEQLMLTTERHHLDHRLNELLGRPANATLAAPEPPPSPPEADQLQLTALEQRLHQHNPQLALLSSRIVGAEKNRDLTYLNRYPDVTVGVSPIQYRDRIREWEVMAEINIPLQQQARRDREREAEQMLNAAQQRQQATANQLLSQLATTLTDIETARRNEQLISTTLLPQTEISHKSALVGYETGRVDFTTLLESQRQWRQVQQNRIKAQTELHKALADLEQLLGEPL